MKTGHNFRLVLNKSHVICDIVVDEVFISHTILNLEDHTADSWRDQDFFIKKILKPEHAKSKFLLKLIESKEPFQYDLENDVELVTFGDVTVVSLNVSKGNASFEDLAIMKKILESSPQALTQSPRRLKTLKNKMKLLSNMAKKLESPDKGFHAFAPGFSNVAPSLLR